MSKDRRRYLRREYLRLGTGELAAGVVFLTVALMAVGFTAESMALWAALLPLLIILTQAGSYWLLARRWVSVGTMPHWLARGYQVFRWLDLGLLAAALAVVLAWRPDHLGALIGVLAIWLFGVTEYVNYFVARLAYSPGRWLSRVRQWRRPQLMKDIAASAPHPL